eukprot:6186709-Pleurochrysis_carterae.AAC.7
MPLAQKLRQRGPCRQAQRHRHLAAHAPMSGAGRGAARPVGRGAVPPGGARRPAARPQWNNNFAEDKPAQPLPPKSGGVWHAESFPNCYISGPQIILDPRQKAASTRCIVISFTVASYGTLGVKGTEV